MNSFIAIFFLAALGSSRAAVTVQGACPAVSVVSNFDAAAYLGTWYEFARYYTTFEEGSSCNTAQYNGNDDGSVAVTNSQIDTKTGAPYSISGTATLDDPASGVAKLTVNFPMTGATSPYWVLGTDYNNYAVVWTCVESTDSAGVVSSSRSLFVITRDRNPLPEVLVEVYDVIVANGIDDSILIYSDQSICY